MAVLETFYCMKDLTKKVSYDKMIMICLRHELNVGYFNYFSRFEQYGAQNAVRRGEELI